MCKRRGVAMFLVSGVLTVHLIVFAPVAYANEQGFFGRFADSFSASVICSVKKWFGISCPTKEEETPALTADETPFKEESGSTPDGDLKDEDGAPPKDDENSESEPGKEPEEQPIYNYYTDRRTIVNPVTERVVSVSGMDEEELERRFRNLDRRIINLLDLDDNDGHDEFTDFSGSLTAAQGGTGQTTYTEGDILVAGSASSLSRLAVGSEGQVLTVSGGVPVWAAASGGGGSSGIAASFTATSSSATSTFAGHISVATDKHYAINGNPFAGITAGGSGIFLGTGNTAPDVDDVAIGINNIADANNVGALALAVGYGNTAQGGFDVLAVGDSNTVTPSGAGIAFGVTNAIYGVGTALGSGNTISADASSAALVVGNSNNALDNFATAIGSGNTANGTNAALAIGYNNSATGAYYASAVGAENSASGYWGATAHGYNNNTTGSYASSFGYNNTASSDNAVAIGYRNTASTGSDASAVGVYNTASQQRASAVGYYNTASQQRTVAFGDFNTASAAYAVGVGRFNTASALNALAFGRSNTVSASGASVFGSSITNTIANSAMFGPSNTAKLTILSTGETQAPFFTATSSSATSTFAGHISVATDKHFAINGVGTLTRQSNGALLMGDLSGDARGSNSIDIQNAYEFTGDGDVASGNYATLVGVGSATGNYASAFGFLAYATSTGSVALGYANSAGGMYSSGIGTFSYAQGDYSTAMGMYTKSLGTYSSAVGAGTFGTYNLAAGNRSNAFGLANNVTADDASAFGSSITNTVAESLMIGPADDSKLTILGANGSEGYVGIGTTTPTAQLSTTGTVRFSNFGAGDLETDANGNLVLASDERLKDIEGDFSRSLSAVLELDPIMYRWSDASGYETKTIYSGFSAQDVNEVIPEAIGQSPDGYLTLSDRPILAAVVNAIKEIWKTVTGNQERIEILEDEVDELREELSEVREALELDKEPTTNISYGNRGGEDDDDENEEIEEGDSDAEGEDAESKDLEEDEESEEEAEEVEEVEDAEGDETKEVNEAESESGKTEDVVEDREEEGATEERLVSEETAG